MILPEPIRYISAVICIIIGVTLVFLGLKTALFTTVLLPGAFAILTGVVVWTFPAHLSNHLTN